MNIKHAKSPCCLGKVIRFGERRRQCSVCHRTWKIRQKKTGRKTIRVSDNLALKFLKNERLSCYSLAKSSNLSEDQLNRRLKRRLVALLRKTPCSKLPQGEFLIVIADAMIQEIEGKLYSIYFILVKEIGSNKAIISLPHFEEGKESYLGWINAFNALPEETFKSIGAVVSDGHRGLVSLAKRNNWLLQRCHFHLLSSLQGRRSKGQYSRHREVGETVFRLVKDILTNTRKDQIQNSICQLGEIRDHTDSPGLKRILRGFLKAYRQFRTYLDFPKLNLPRTSNSAESVVGSVRSLLHRTKGFRTLSSFKLWVEGLIKIKKEITSNGFHQSS